MWLLWKRFFFQLEFKWTLLKSYKEEQPEEAEVIEIWLKLFLILKLPIQITALLFENMCLFSVHLRPFFGGVFDWEREKMYEANRVVCPGGLNCCNLVVLT